MKRHFCYFAVLFAIALFPVRGDAYSPYINLYNGDGIFAQEEGLESTVIVDSVSGTPTVRLWYTRWTYTNSNYAIGGTSYGTVSTSPALIASSDIYYMDCPVSSFTSAVAAGTPIPWANKGLCVSTHGESSVSKGPDGNYHMMANYSKWLFDDGLPMHIDYYTSTTGMPGSWTLITASAITAPSGFTGIANNWVTWSGTTPQVIVEEANADYSYTQGYWTGPSLSALVNIANNLAPTPGPVGSTGQILGTYYGNVVQIGHGPQNYTTNVTLPSVLNMSKASFLGSTWSFVSQILAPSDLAYFHKTKYGTTYPYDTVASGYPQGDSQLADPTVFEINGVTYIIYESIYQERHEVPSLSVIWFNYPISSVVYYYENGTLPSSSKIPLTRTGGEPLTRVKGISTTR
jgi:hypothetical protein